MLPFGGHLLAVDTDSKLTVWEVETQEVYLPIEFGANIFDVSALCHPATYKNKVLLGSEQGALKLFNVKTNHLIFDFDGFGSSVRVIDQSPAVDVVAVGLADGRIALHNIRLDETLFTFKQDWSVTSISFRTDGPETMISSGTEGHLAVWDLNKKRLLGQMTDAHRSQVTIASCVVGEPLMVSAGTDNALRTWIFDQPDGLGRELSLRDGHSAPASTVRFHGADGEWLVSASLDGTVRAFSAWKDTKQQNLGTAGTMSRAQAKRTHRDLDQIRLPAVVAMDAGTAREGAWDNVVCVHDRSPIVTTWTTKKQRLGTHQLLHHRFDSDPRLRQAVAVSVCVSACGNFALIGYSSGHVDCFNIQSGKHRGAFKDPAVVTEGDKATRAHSASVVGVGSDALNQTVVTGCAGDRLKFWTFKTKKIIRTLDVGSPIVRMTLNRDNGLLGVALANGAVGVVDVQCRRVVRRFNKAHRAPVLALAFNADGHWLVTTDAIRYMKVWNLSTATLVDVLRFESPCCAVSLSPTGEYMATCHQDRRGVFLWANKAVYQQHLPLKPLPLDFEPAVATLPQSAGGSEQAAVDNVQVMEIGEDDDDDDDLDADETKPNRQQIAVEMVTLSGLPAPRWAQLPDMDLIRLRNKPKEPPKKPKAAPFFLPTVATLEGFAFDAPMEADDGGERSRILTAKRSFLEPSTKFGVSILDADTVEKRRSAFEALKGMGPSAIDLELRTLPNEALLNFLQMLVDVVRLRTDFELAQAYLASFLKIHRDALWSLDDAQLLPLLRELNETQKSAWDALDDLMIENLGVIQWLKSAVL
uniref:Small-subunit processome Utp21 domain-containing protein n=1 Tax=Plectus sambesii TaxID=2011161 RepID=A0A914XT60_9BILA